MMAKVFRWGWWLILLIACDPDVQHAEAQAKAYCRTMKLKCEAVVCISKDSDGDGYVTCSAKLEDNAEVVPLERVSQTYDTGCKPALPKSRTTNVVVR